MLTDVEHNWGSDLAVSAKGDVAVAATEDTVKQRIVRRLMTNPGEYLWNIDFGAGLSAFVGQPRSADRVAAIVASQILKEQTVAPFPPPTVTTELLGSNGVVVTIKYHDKSSGIQTNLKLPVQL